ncbi:MAG: gas vesicle protein K [Gemmatimonadaceae bacterium]|nr:gas vesicle protein K [Gemmatimonadaceae bacterium]
MADSDLFSEDRLDLGDLLNHVLDKGVVLHGDIMLSVADVDLVRLNLGLLLAAVETSIQKAPRRTQGTLATAFGPPDFRPMELREAEKSEGEAGRNLAANPAAPQSSLAAERHPSPLTGDVDLNQVATSLPERINADPEKIENGLARLVLTLIEVLRKVLEHQAVRRMEGGSLSEEEIERLGLALLRLNDRMKDMKGIFGLEDDDLNIDLGPLGRLG